MLDHVGIPVSDYARSKRIYLQALRPLGYDLVREVCPWRKRGARAMPASAPKADRKSTPSPPSTAMHLRYSSITNRAMEQMQWRA